MLAALGLTLLAVAADVLRGEDFLALLGLAAPVVLLLSPPNGRGGTAAVGFDALVADATGFCWGEAAAGDLRADAALVSFGPSSSWCVLASALSFRIELEAEPLNDLERLERGVSLGEVVAGFTSLLSIDLAAHEG